ncbi:MAG: hypothetical protein KC587_08755, partial [Nitrospira sp.]|nr:hypothetical protein [Nitrospira sp.]
MSESDRQMVSEFPLLRVGILGLQERDLSPSCQRVLASQGSMLQISWLDYASVHPSCFDSDNPFDLILLDCRVKGIGEEIACQIKKIYGNAFILGLINDDISDGEGISEPAIDWLVNEHLASIAMPWAIQEGLVRRRGLIEREQLRKQVEDAFYNIEMADIASTVLHNVGNVLNSVNVAVNVVHELIHQSSVILVHRIAELL